MRNRFRDRSPDLPSEDIEHGIERFGATFPESDRLRAVLSANPCTSTGAER